MAIGRGSEIGIATGTVVVGEAMDSNGVLERDIAGVAANLAARLQQFGEPGTIIVSSSTHSLAGAFFRYADLGEVVLRGFPEPVRAFRVLGIGPAESRIEAHNQERLTPFVGRKREMANLLDRWDLARNGSGQIAMIAGEPGIGKTRLTLALVDALAHEQPLVLRASCQPSLQDTPFAPLTRMLEKNAGLLDSDTPKVRAIKMSLRLARSEDERRAIALTQELRAPPASTDPDPHRSREALFSRLVEQVEILAKKQPLLMMVEDAHWCDPSTLEVLQRVAAHVASWPMLLIVTFRPEFSVPGWAAARHVHRVSLLALTPEQASLVVQQVAGRRLLPGHVSDGIVRRTDGVPLFVEELTKTVLEALAPEPDDQPPLLLGQNELAVPATIQGLLASRIDRLGPAREVAQIGAVIGREFSHDLLTAIAQKPPAELEAGLDRLIRSGLVFRQRTEGELSFQFKHALVQDAAYSMLLRSTRRDVHKRIVTVLEKSESVAVSSNPALLAHHATKAGMIEQGVTYWWQAVKLALQRSSMKEAMTQLTNALQLLAGAPSSEWRHRRELDLWTMLGRVLIAVRGHAAQATGDAFTRARALCDQHGEKDQLVPVLYGQWTHALLRGDLKVAQSRANELLDLGQRRQDPVWQLIGHRAAGVTCFPSGEFKLACQHLDRGLEMFDPTHRARVGEVTLDDVEVVMLYYSAWSLLYLGDTERAKERCVLVLARARKLDRAFTTAHALIASVHTNLMLRDLPAADQDLLEVEALSAKYDILYFRLVARLFRGQLMSLHGRVAEAVELLSGTLDVYKQSGSQLYLPTFLTYLARACLRDGQLKAAAGVIAEAERLTEATGVRCDEADLHQARGELLLACGEQPQAENAFRQAVATARRQDARLWELNGATALAGLLRDQGRSEEGYRALQPVVGWFADSVDVLPLRTARDMLRELA